MTALALSALACGVWVYLLLLRGRFWCAVERDEIATSAQFMPAKWPQVAVIMPARNEAAVIAATIGSLLRQDYRGAFEIVVIDDQSNDGTAAIARDAAAAAGTAHRLVVLSAADLPHGWTGKLWAMHSGVIHVNTLTERPDYLLFSDADICYASDALTEVVLRAQRGGLVLTSLMAKLNCQSFGERTLIPAFIFFFQMLYPFAWVNRPDRRTAAAAGGCMLVRWNALQAAGGLAAIRGELIDDCALGRLLKLHGPIWLGLTERAHSIRAFRSVGDIGEMIVRTAYTQLRYSPWLLLGTILAIALTFLAPPVLTVVGTGIPHLLGAAAWAQMALAMQPVLRFYGVSRWWGVALPAIAGAYLAFTLVSAFRHWRGRGGMWKGRAHTPVQDRR